MRTRILLPLVCLLGACAGIPAEDNTRALSFAWDLTPEHFDKSVEQIEQGDIFFEWTATTSATHEAQINGRNTYLAQASTHFGNLYCTFSDSDNSCYEDRDADGLFERRWKAEHLSRSPANITTARLPEEVQPPIPFQTTTRKDRTIATQRLGLLYNGPVSGAIDENGNFTTIIGELAIGWHAGKSELRDPTGFGWKYQNAVLFAILPELAPEVVVRELGLRYTALKATVEGGLELEYQATAMDGVDLNREFDYDIDKREVIPEDPEV